MPEAQDPILTPEQAAELLKMQPSTVKAWARAGKLPGAFKVGKVWRFNRRIMLEELGKKRDQGSDKP